MLHDYLIERLGNRVPDAHRRGRPVDLEWIARHVVLTYEERALVRYALKELEDAVNTTVSFDEESA